MPSPLIMEVYLCSYCRLVDIRGFLKLRLSYEFAIMYSLGESLHR